MRGSTPAGVAVPSGAISTTVIADLRAQLARQRIAEDDAVAAVGSRSSMLPAVMRCASPVARRSSLGQHAAHGGAGDVLPVRQHRLALDVGHRRQHARLLQRTCACSVAPVGERAVEARERGMRGDAQDAAAQFALEAVHDREHHDQHRDARASARSTDISATKDRSRAGASSAGSACRSAIRRQLMRYS